MRFPVLVLTFIVALTACSHTNPLHVNSPSPDLPFAEQKAGAERGQYEARASRFMVATQGAASTRAGAKMFELGGNAIDAAAAVSFAISVERPQSTGIGGGGFMLLHFRAKRETVAVDFREKAPARASERMFLDKKGEPVPRLSLDTPLSSGVPGLVAGIIEVHAKYGKLKLAAVLAPAIELAENGFPVYPDLAEDLETRKEILALYPDSRKIFLKADGSPLRTGDLLVQKDLAATLRKIAKGGRDAFYKGEIADAIAASHARHKGLITKQDLESYNVVWRQPVWGDYKGYSIASMPPPSSGGVHVIEILNILEGLDFAQNGPTSPTAIHLTASAMQRAFADRAAYLGDSDFVKVPVAGLLTKDYARTLRAEIHPTIAAPSRDLKAGNPWPFQNPHESKQTTHFTIMDSDGNTVASTQTINTEFGSGLVAEGTGILLNNEMDDFSAKPGAINAFGAVGSRQNAIAPGKRPLSSMSPTIVFQKGRPILALGTPSGTRIITCVTQTILNYLEYKMPLYDAVASVRYHHQWSPDEIRVDPPGFSPTLTQKLRAMGHSVRVDSLGCQVNAIAREGSQLLGVADPRGEGMSYGK